MESEDAGSDVAEVDVVLELPGRTVLVEIKAGRRVAADAGRHLAAIGDKVLRDPMLVGDVEQVIVHGGDVQEARQGMQLLPWGKVAEFPWN